MSQSTRCVGVALLVSVLGWLGGGQDAQALPRMSLTAGTPCSACHVNVQGGGGRTEIGWGSMALTGAFTYDQLGLDALNDQETNLLFNGYASIGLDARGQLARLGRPTLEVGDDGQTMTVPPGRVFFPMQIQPYLTVSPSDKVKLYGTYALGPNSSSGEVCDAVYAGQSCFEAQAIVQYSPSAPTIRVGQMQPSIGIRHDDHTMLIRGDASQPRQPLIAPNYADVGAELSYHPRYWFQTEVGGFWARNLAEAVRDPRVVAPTDPAALGRVMFSPRYDFDGGGALLSWVGASLYLAGKLRLENYFVGLGLLNLGSLMVEASRSTRGDEADHATLNLMTVLSIPIKDWLVVEGRVERGTASVRGEAFETRAAVASLQFFPLPYIELRPEYRYTDTDTYRLGQYTLQVHLFY